MAAIIPVKYFKMQSCKYLILILETLINVSKLLHKTAILAFVLELREDIKFSIRLKLGAD